MVKCNTCGKERVVEVSAKCSDLCNVRLLQEDGGEEQGYVPSGLGIGGGDYIEFRYCLDCGRIQGEQFPLLDGWVIGMDTLKDCGRIQGGQFPLPKTRLEGTEE